MLKKPLEGYTIYIIAMYRQTMNYYVCISVYIPDPLKGNKTRPKINVSYPIPKLSLGVCV